jgi:hypothetical protein
VISDFREKVILHNDIVVFPNPLDVFRASLGLKNNIIRGIVC